MLADTVPLRARLVWLGGAIAASVVAFALTRPAPRLHHRHFQPVMGACGDHHPHVVLPRVMD
ncbi:MAG TPA: hypothetical protein VLX92_32885 [Kofleriaceae bacterium]|nr:hypothetical protein [Kofleriaceae bacterium]